MYLDEFCDSLDGGGAAGGRNGRVVDRSSGSRRYLH